MAARPLSRSALLPIPRQTLRTPIADQLRAFILDGRMAPGERIVELGVAAQLGVSRAPLREALWQLAKEGLVRFEPNRGAFVAELSAEDVTHIFEIRQALETQAAVRIFERQDEAAFRALEQRCAALEAAGTRKDMRAFAEADVAFHKTLWHHAGNPILEEVLCGVSVRFFGYGLIRDLPRASAYAFDQVVAEHRKMLALMRAGPKARIVRGFAHALRAFRDYSLERFANAATQKNALRSS
ncbi:MAG: GntR family transcriptional regulator [Myxococcales bacterium]|nr:GntR family transcriptional regulator [Myxococcales bacterium]